MDVFDSMHWRPTKKLMSALGAWPFQPVIQQKILGSLFYFIIQSIYVVEVLEYLYSFTTGFTNLYIVRFRN